MTDQLSRIVASLEVQLTKKCHHINADLSMCNKKSGYSMSCMCKNHFKDIGGSEKAGKIQMERLMKIRKINHRLAQTGMCIIDPMRHKL